MVHIEEIQTVMNNKGVGTGLWGSSVNGQQYATVPALILPFRSSRWSMSRPLHWATGFVQFSTLWMSVTLLFSCTSLSSCGLLSMISRVRICWLVDSSHFSLTLFPLLRHLARVLFIDRCFGLITSLIDLCLLFNNHDKYFISEYMIVYGMVSGRQIFSKC